MSYQPADAKKIEGNAAWGRFINTLNEKNKSAVIDLYADALEDSIREWAKKNVVIRIRK
mgnify:CR=1 FL=1